jgi:hypothetical protein
MRCNLPLNCTMPAPCRRCPNRKARSLPPKAARRGNDGQTATAPGPVFSGDPRSNPPHRASRSLKSLCAADRNGYPSIQILIGHGRRPRFRSSRAFRRRPGWARPARIHPAPSETYYACGSGADLQKWPVLRGELPSELPHAHASKRGLTRPLADDPGCTAVNYQRLAISNCTIGNGVFLKESFFAMR